MNFEYERFTKDFILRRVRSEEARTGRRVTRVILTTPEWHAFIHAENMLGLHWKIGDSYRIANPAPLGYCQPGEWGHITNEISYFDVVCQ